MSTNITLFRKRFIPNEIVHLKDDKILSHSDEMIITQWNTLKPRTDISRGVSAYFIKEGYKVSKIYDRDDHIVYWYCDIIRVPKNSASTPIIFEDLLLDVIIYENGLVKVIDAKELGEALEKGYIDTTAVIEAMYSLDRLLTIIYDGRFHTLQYHINKAEQDNPPPTE